jgi:hypothetical protein
MSRTLGVLAVGLFMRLVLVLGFQVVSSHRACGLSSLFSCTLVGPAWA